MVQVNKKQAKARPFFDGSRADGLYSHGTGNMQCEYVHV